MFIIGKANNDEIAQIEALGFKYENVDVNHFDKALDPSAPDSKPDVEEDGDRLISIFIDCDVLDEVKNIHDEEIIMTAFEEEIKT